VNEKTAGSLTEVVAGEFRRIPGLQIITEQEITALVGYDKQRSMFGCQDDSCLAQIGGALGADRIAFGTISKLGESWLATLKLMDVKKAKTLSQADRRIRNGSIDDVLDVVPSMVAELMGAPAAAAPVRTSAAAAVAAAEEKPLPPRWAEVPMDVSSFRAELKLAKDAKGRYVAWRPYGTGEEYLFAGDGKRFFAQRVYGGGRNGDDIDYTFWEPRAKAPWQASFETKEGKPQLYCGEKPAPLTLVPDAKAKKLLAGAQFFKPRWQRAAQAIARDDLGNYYFVDQARLPEDNKDFQVYVGTKGKLKAMTLEDAIIDDAGQIFVTAAGRLRLGRNPEECEWIHGAVREKLRCLNLYQQAPFAYTELGVYAGESLGTLCDGAY